MPFLPAIPGVPQLPPSVTQPLAAILATQAISGLLWQASQAPPAWGVFDTNGNQVLAPDSTLEFLHRKEFEVSAYPVQEGEFASYNKVRRPYEIQLRFSKGGTQGDRTKFLNDLDNLMESIELFTVLTPERQYNSVNMTRYEVIRRGVRGAYFLTEVDAFFLEIHEVQPQYTTTGVQAPNAESEAAQPSSNVGNVQPQTPDSQETQDGNAALGSTSQGFF